MRQNPAQQHRTGRSSGKGESAYRAASKRPGPGRVARRRTAMAASRRRRKSRRPLLFFAVVASFAAELAAIFADIGVLVALFALVGLLLCAVVIRAEG